MRKDSVSVVVVGNKSDPLNNGVALLGDRAACRLAGIPGIPYSQPYYETSAKTGSCVAMAFADLTKQIILSNDYVNVTREMIIANDYAREQIVANDYGKFGMLGRIMECFKNSNSHKPFQG